jgi:hypothetical protein
MVAPFGVANFLEPIQLWCCDVVQNSTRVSFFWHPYLRLALFNQSTKNTIAQPANQTKTKKLKA